MPDKNPDAWKRFVWTKDDITIVKRGEPATPKKGERRPQAPKRKRGKTVEIKTD
jgi:hypothetical protein